MTRATHAVPASRSYRGRLAPSPTGYLHLGHARTFWIAQQRAQKFGGTLVLRNEDLDRARCQREFVAAMTEDLRWFGFQWQEGPDCGGALGPYTQSERFHFYRAALEKLKAGESIYPCTCSRKDILNALTAPHETEAEPIYPGTCRSNRQSQIQLALPRPGRRNHFVRGRLPRRAAFCCRQGFRRFRHLAPRRRSRV